jgi:hypothetical protein
MGLRVSGTWTSVPASRGWGVPVLADDLMWAPLNSCASSERGGTAWKWIQTDAYAGWERGQVG